MSNNTNISSTYKKLVPHWFINHSKTSCCGNLLWCGLDNLYQDIDCRIHTTSPLLRIALLGLQCYSLVYTHHLTTIIMVYSDIDCWIYATSQLLGLHYSGIDCSIYTNIPPTSSILVHLLLLLCHYGVYSVVDFLNIRWNGKCSTSPLAVVLRQLLSLSNQQKYRSLVLAITRRQPPCYGSR